MLIPTIGLEIHVELKTKTKMFCRCLNDPNETHPNVNVCSICLGHPGTLPVINKEAVLKIIKIGLALGGEVNQITYFDRKSYFYPDLPKGYQISQYEKPLIKGGLLKGIRIRRIHLEEDTGRLLHELPSNEFLTLKGKYSYVDFNRAGVPLMELVTEPDIKNAEEAVEFAKELQLILRYLEVSDADMEKGQMRLEANVSLNMGTKVELKNINSFKALHDAIEYEIKRQKEVLARKEKVIQETRGWDDKKGITRSQRSKESAHDYRYFPEPDLPPLDLRFLDLEQIKREIPELPEEKRKRFVQEFGLEKSLIEILVEDRKRANFFEEAASELKNLNQKTDYVLLVNYFTSDLRGLMLEKKLSFDDLKITPENFAHLIFLIEKGELSSRLAKDLIKKMVETGEDPESIIKNEGLKLISEEKELEKIVEEIVLENPQSVNDYKKGKINALQFLVGKGMQKTKGQADPEKLKEIILKKINQS